MFVLLVVVYFVFVVSVDEGSIDEGRKEGRGGMEGLEVGSWRLFLDLGFVIILRIGLLGGR